MNEREPAALEQARRCTASQLSCDRETQIGEEAVACGNIYEEENVLGQWVSDCATFGVEMYHVDFQKLVLSHGRSIVFD